MVKNGAAGWHKPSDCLWSSTTDIREKVSLNDDYEDLKDLFVNKLGVKTLTIQMVYDELMQTTLETPIANVTSTLWSLNALLLSETKRPDPHALLEIPIFPVQYANGQKVLMDIGTDFAIIDSESLARRFRGKIKILDFTREEVLQLRPLIEWAGLTTRYLSAIVRESTSVGESPAGPVTNPNHDIKRKAHAILR